MEPQDANFIEKDLRQLFELSLSERIRRHLEVKPHPIIANHYFSSASTECVELFRDGHFYGCISLVQTVAEALVKFLCTRNGWKPDKKFEKNVGKLVERGFVSDDLRTHLLQAWNARDDYHHLNANIETERKELEGLARAKVKSLAVVEGDIFGFAVIDGGISPCHPKYWDIQDGKAQVFLRCI